MDGGSREERSGARLRTKVRCNPSREETRGAKKRLNVRCIESKTDLPRVPLQEYLRLGKFSDQVGINKP